MVSNKRTANDSPASASQTSKRARTSTATSARDQVIWLSANPPTRTMAKCIQFAHPHVLKLFEEVKNTEHFRVASKVFWLSYFAHQRGETEDNRNELFKLVAERTNLIKNAQFPIIWDQVHESILSEFITKFDAYFQAWLKSPAGNAYEADIANRRQKKSAIPGFDPQQLKEFTDAAGEIHRGIDWSVKEIFDIFRPLSSIAEIVDVKPNSSVVDIQIDDGSASPLYGDEHLYKWFKADLKTVDGVSIGTHWHQLFSKVANGVMLQSVLLYFGMQTRGGSKTCYDVDSLRQLIERIPTTGSSNEKTVIEFPTLKLSLAEWTERLASDEEESQTSAPSPANNNVPGDEQLQAIREMKKKNELETMSEMTMDKLKQDGENKTLVQASALHQEFDAIGEDVFDFLQRDFAETALYPPEPMQQPRWTLFLEKMALTNIYGKIELMKGQLHKVEKGMKLVMKSCKSHIQDLQKATLELDETAKRIAEAEEELGEKFAETESLSSEVMKLHATVQRGLNNPEIARYVNFDKKRGQNLFSSVSTISPVPRNPTSYGHPVTAGTSLPSIAQEREETGGGLPGAFDNTDDDMLSELGSEDAKD